ncbi:tail fiber protein [Achromobacter ruhlandii]|uniref:tail fiber protein n=1 Tax=Achromobacter ruhlandii TaxID=72557 RepID=UPI001B8CF07B|nr:tail fiber protein [Achromobacter ruhlandii]
MAINQILPFGTVPGANVLAPADYQALAARLGGFSAGTAKSKELNTVWRQASFVAAMIGQYIADKAGQDVLDDGDLAALQARFVAALAASPAFTGTPTAPTPVAGDKSDRLATTAFVSGNFPRICSITALPTQDVGPIVVAERSEVWTWSAGQYFTGYRSPMCGMSASWLVTTPPAGWLVEDGAAISVAVYGALAAAIYCGDANNATAEWGYRCTNAGNPTSSRSTSGTYIVLRDRRGLFERSLDSGRGIDPGRSLWTRQEGTEIPNAVFGASGGSLSIPISWGDSPVVVTAQQQNWSAGVNATLTKYRMRPGNVAALACIKF